MQSSKPRPAAPIGRKLTAKAAAPEKPGARVSEEQATIKNLQREVDKAKESERKMLESMISQTKQLEKTKIELEEAKLELRNLAAEMAILRSEAEESSAAWQAKELGFISCIKASEEEIDRLKEEGARCRDVMKQAVSEAMAAKEGLEMARRENSNLKDVVSARESSLRAMKQDLECAKLDKAAALDAVRDLQVAPRRFSSTRWSTDRRPAPERPLSSASDLGGARLRGGGEQGEAAKEKKKGQILRKFSELLRRGRHAK
ncbi:myosin heavy chain-related protein isoform X2 [Wolffia australiana]